MAGDHSQSWYVKASFGTEWGPMSLETLREMADHGDLARSDLARCGVDADWQPVSIVLDQVQSADAITDLIQQAPDATSVATSDATESLNEPASEPLPLKEEVVASVPSKPSQDRRRGLPNWSNYWDPDSVGSENPPPASMLRVVLDEVPVRLQQASLPDSETETEVVAPVHATDDHSDDSPIESTLPSGDFAELDAWKRKRSEQLERLLKIVSDREAKAAEDRKSVV